MTRLRTLAAAMLLCALAVTVTPAGAGAASSQRYWQFADARAGEMNRHWDERQGMYTGPAGAETARTNAGMLLVHALAATAAHHGPARADARARAITARLLAAPAWTEVPGNGQAHAPGWTSVLEGTGKQLQHVSVDPQVVEALSAARDGAGPLGLDAATTALIAANVSAVARSDFYRYPAIRLNQMNWHADMYAADHAVSGDPTLLTNDYRQQLARFATNASRPSPRSPWLTSGHGLLYLPHQAPGKLANATSTSEYAGIVLSALRHYDHAVAAGMVPLSAGQVAVLRAFAQRHLYGDWNHSGYLNWDSALGFHRWHLLRYWPLAASGILGLAASTPGGLIPAADRAAATALLDRALSTYESWQAAGTLGAMAFGMRGPFLSPLDDQYGQVRWAALAARAASSTVPAVRPVLPAAFMAADPDIGRVAVSTRRYWTALSPPTTIGYGGAELARLHDSATGQPLSGTGGRRDGAFGLALTRRGRALLDTQPGSQAHAAPSWKLSGARRRGAFTRLVADTVVRGPGTRVRVRVRHEFTVASIRTTRVVRAGRDATATVRFPVWGKTRVVLPVNPPRAGMTLRAGGYRVRLGRVPAGARLRLVGVAPQRSSPGTRRVITLTFKVRAGHPVGVSHEVLTG